ncbi:hypothetical protein CPB86DRAFT_812298 [Serendipita vermifera]|nr:hypothetical protein CPB86DRAFT_812298 [Serendipita vermifera]
MDQVPSSDLLQAPNTQDIDAYSSSSSLPTASSSHPMTSIANTNTQQQQQEITSSSDAEVEASSSTAKEAKKTKDKPPTPSRKSSLLATFHLAPPSSWRLRRASSVTKSNGKPTVDIRAAAISSPNLPTRDNNSDIASQAPISPNNDVAIDDGDESDNDEVSEIKSHQSRSTRGKFRTSRSYSEASLTKDSETTQSSGPKKMLGSAIGSIKRRMGLKSAQHEDSRALTSKAFTPKEPEPEVRPDLTDSKVEDEGEEIGELKRKDTTFDDGVPEKTKRRRSIRDSIRAKRESFSFLKSKAPTPDTFAFGASPNLYETPAKSGFPSTMPDERLDVSVDAPPEGDSTLVSSPLGETNSEDVNLAAGASRQSLSSSKRPTVKHTTSAPPRSIASSIKSESGSMQESSSQRKSITGARESMDGYHRHHQGSPSKHRHEHKHHHHHHSLISKLIPGHGGDKAMDKLEKLTSLEDIAVPQEWLTGVIMIKISDKGEKRRGFRIDPDQGLILWDSKSANIIMIENIKELRKGESIRYYREFYKAPESYEKTWLTISYLADGKYKTLHVVALSEEQFISFYQTVDRLRELRNAMLSLPSNMMGASSSSTVGNGELPDKITYPDASLADSDAHRASRDSQHPKHHHPHNHSLTRSHWHLTHEERQILWERHYWKGADFTGDKRLDFKEIEKMARRLSLGIGISELKRLFEKADVSKNGTLDFEEFRELWRGLRIRTEMRVLFNKTISDAGGKPGEGLSFEGFELFMRAQQKDTRTTEELQKLFECYALTEVSQVNKRFSVQTSPKLSENMAEPSSPGPEGSMMLNLDGFTAYLMSSDNAPFADGHLGIHQDMNRPLSDYYISSSHNTYLVGHQLVGDSTIEGYIRVLLHSCRCVEIDIYDGDKEPMITHGGTLTSKIPLRTICEVIAKNAFVTSPYPVIVSAEVHCSLPQQDKIAEIMRECFGEMLVDKRIEGHAPTELPSPEMLKHKIMLKTKNPRLVEAAALVEVGSPNMGSAIDTGTETGVTSDPETGTPERRGSFGVGKKRRSSRSPSVPPFMPSSPTQIAGNGGNILEGTQTEVRSPPPIPASEGTKIKAFSASLADILIYTIGVKYRGINKKETYAPEHMFSLSEKSVDKILKQGSLYYVGRREEDEEVDGYSVSGGMMDLIKHTQDHLVRIYPKGIRVSSSNYQPHRYWATGAQLVALNWQTSDLGYIMNHAMFMRNGKCGYVLKPVSLRSKDKKVKELVSRRQKYILKLRIISAQQIPRPRDKDGREVVDRSTMDPFVQVAVHVPDWPGAPRVNAAVVDEESTSPTAQANEFGSTPPKSSPLRRRSVSPTGGRPRYAFQSASTAAQIIRAKTAVVKNNGFNPVWEESMSLKFEVAGDMLDLVFIRFIVRDEDDDDDDRALAMYCTSLGSLRQGYRHLPLHDEQMSQYLFATLFVHIDLQKFDQ